MSGVLRLKLNSEAQAEINPIHNKNVTSSALNLFTIIVWSLITGVFEITTPRNVFANLCSYFTQKGNYPA